MPPTARRLLSWALLLVAVLTSRPSPAQLRELGDGSTASVTAAHLTAALIDVGTRIAPGGSATVGLSLALEKGWHVYWVDAGDSGQPPTVQWSLPRGITAGEMQFAAPTRLPLGPLMDYGYEGTAIFPFTLHAAADAPTGPVRLDAHVRWLVCREVCIPGRAHLGLDLAVVPGAPSVTPATGALAAALASEPRPLPPGTTVRASGTKDHLTLTVSTGHRESHVQFFPLSESLLHNAADQPLDALSTGARLHLERGDIANTLPKTIQGVLRIGDTAAYTLDLPVSPATAVDTATGGGQTAELSVFAAIALALVGGIVLNLMPCVFPVLFLKGLSLVESSSGERKHIRLHGLVYTAGIVASFWAIVGVLLVLRAGGHQAGWGFQLQSPVFVVLMASLLFFLALSLAGQFEIGLSVTSAGDSLTRKQGYAGSFFTGVLATVVATPCTAPLMGAAIGFALAQPPVITFVVFTALALGLALPYLLLTLQPGWAKLLPRPGAWMETLKQLTAVPLLLTIVWLVWVYGRLFPGATGEGADHIARLLVGLIVLSIAGWTLGRWPARRTSSVVAGLLVLVSLAVSLSAPRVDKLDWQPFSAEAASQARAQGHPVFVDFTAAWCLSCQVNERAVLHDASVEREFQSQHFVLLRADWTRYDPAITQELARSGRSGVPTYVIYPAKEGEANKVLPELLTRSIVLNALAPSKQLSASR